MLVICTWLWGDKYPFDHVIKLRRGVQRHLKQPHRFLLMTERERSNITSEVERHAIKDPLLLQYQGCFARLRMFDYGWQQNRRIDERLVCMDLDTVITGPLDPVFDRPEPFVILSGANSLNPCPYNGSLMMLRAGYHGDVWNDFDIVKARELPYYKFPDDQGWLHHKIPNAATWKAGENGVYAFQKPGWPSGEDLPKDARLVVFPGWRQPSKFLRLKWVRQNW